MLIAVDFDATLVNMDRSIPGARDAMLRLRGMGHKILIHSCNNKSWIEKVLNAEGIPYDYIWDSAHDVGKPACGAYLDDRGVGFDGDWDKAINEIENIEERRKKVEVYI